MMHSAALILLLSVQHLEPSQEQQMIPTADQAASTAKPATAADNLRAAVERLLQQADEGPRGCYGRDSGGREDWKGSFHERIETLRAAVAAFDKAIELAEAAK